MLGVGSRVEARRLTWLYILVRTVSAGCITVHTHAPENVDAAKNISGPSWTPQSFK